jgi:hypothetical protein
MNTDMNTPDLLTAAKDALESLKRLPDVDGAYRVTCIAQLEIAIRGAKRECTCETLYDHHQNDACIEANGLEPVRFHPWDCKCEECEGV